MTRDNSKGKIYKIEPIVDHEEHEIYFGSRTKEYLSPRMSAHKNKFSCWTNDKRGELMVFDIFKKHEMENCNSLREWGGGGREEGRKGGREGGREGGRKSLKNLASLA